MVLRLFAVFSLMVFSGAGGAIAASILYEREFCRLHEEIEGYKELADKTTSMSGKALIFAQRYQEVLDTCLTRLYGGPTTEPVVDLWKGGVGGPEDARGASRLP